MSQQESQHHVIIGTAGHIDHGKTWLIKALTGIDADTLPEEKRRGITIELGFVFMDEPAFEKQLVFIDVPGHERLVRTMVAGASSIDAALIVIAADEGICQQTREHFDILQLLGIDRGVVVLTKADLVGPSRLEELASEVRGFLKGSLLEGAPVIPASSVTGGGVEDVRQALAEIASFVKRREDSGVFRMPIDRVFTLRGFGTVVAGTILSGGVSRGDRIEIFPEGMIARVRNVQVHHRKVERSGVGLRTALNIPDVRREDLRRGQCAGEPGSLSPTFRMDGRLHLLKSAGKPLKNRARIRFHTGTAEIMARVVLLDKETVHPGESGLVQFVLEAPGVALPRDRFVIRTFSPLMTIGGGVILDASPPKHKRQDGRSAETLTRIESGLKGFVEQVVSEAGLKPCQFSRIRTRTGRSAEAVHEALCALVEEGRIVQIPGFRESAYIHREGMERLKMDILSDVRDYLQKNPHRPAMPYEELRSWALRRTESAVLKKILDHLVDTQRLESRGADVALPGFRARLDPREKEMMGRIERTFQASGLTPPLEEDVRKSLGIPPRVFGNLMYSLFESQRLVRLNDRVVYHRDFLEKARRTVIAYLEQRATIAVAELRDLLKISRKYATAILEYFDRVGLTKREEDVHILRR